MFGFVSGYLGGRRALSRAVKASTHEGGLTSAFAPDPLADLASRLDRMTLVVEALWELLRQHGHTDEQLEEIVTQLHARSTQAVTCPSCGATISGSAMCQICGADSGLAPPSLDR